MKISNVKVYGLEESILASGYPMMSGTYPEYEFNEICRVLKDEELPPTYDQHLKRMKHLGNATPNSGHDCGLKGIIVQYDMVAPEYFWRQFDRYHFHDYIASMSKMHRILRMDINEMCNPYVREDVKESLKEEINLYNQMYGATKAEKQEQFQRVISNCPMGLELTARITDNYLQLKSKYNQRHNHKLEEWQYYCDWIKTLPRFTELCLAPAHR
ncbi:hypothetical protein SAMN05446037_1006113 [Anaerovirgula multivorans]|uniref:Thymidylate synthase complementing protein n=1 Tax=Anaerovirgula multivorans TaxID=312168 RepID=A0A239CRH9_9FIRM|nr:hypothetical protein [Anaerovirgula multivorans]SNS22697.1 hypothetical protein SAMN05446037_1006113 [Anaerovirgula multivorans]